MSEHVVTNPHRRFVYAVWCWDQEGTLRTAKVWAKFSFRCTKAAPIHTHREKTSNGVFYQSYKALAELWIERAARKLVWRLEPPHCADRAFEPYI